MMRMKIAKRIKEIKKELKELESDWKLAQKGQYDMIENEYHEAKYSLLDELESIQK
jgi:hypothetical protein